MDPSPTLASNTGRQQSDERGTGGIFSRELRGSTVGILLGIGVVAFESLGVATVLPTIATELGGMGSYGWGLAALMLANIIGTVVAGASIDRRGPLRTVIAGSIIFAAGCALAGAAASWELFIAARALQGLGVGAVMAYAYSVVVLAYPRRLHAVMFACLSSAWTIPSLLGPVLAGLLTAWLDWRVVFWALSPAMLLLLPLILPTVKGLARSPQVKVAGTASAAKMGRTTLYAVMLVAGAAVLLAGLELPSVALAAAAVILGTGAAVVALRHLTPAGTFKAARGAPAGIVIRFLLCAVYFGSEAFLPLGLMGIHGWPVTLAGAGLAAGALAWSAGSFLQARLDSRHPGRRHQAVTTGIAILVAGELLMGIAVSLPAMWGGWAVVGWAIGGVGMGIAFNAATSATMAASNPERTGSISASLQLSQTLATALIAGIGGAVIAGVGAGTTGFLTIFSITALLGIVGLLLGRRIQPSPAT
ncbi:hypothetical protein ART_1332 [Arthrobacter sp. PAMC 25486]|uniref:MFS transporter n=1 Tax=Arthrobacter sp. PAMC 25486 TaxID=1494608 RepID=UPI00053637DE|nr:MFS transporter [Arthrobacter sp. PAMC 25486]AIY00931.1 hypothetical protein ART_1332 [Arthrobacter sp. PAMC 25486]